MTKTLLPTLLIIFATIFVFSTGVTYANTDFQPLDELCLQAPNSPVCQEHLATRGETAEDNRIVSFLGEVVSVMLYALGIASVIAVIVGGILYTISGGDPAKTKQARDVIIYALVGLVIASIAQLIILYVLDRL